MQTAIVIAGARRPASHSATVYFAGTGELPAASVRVSGNSRAQLLRTIFDRHAARGYRDEGITVRMGGRLYSWDPLRALTCFHRRNPDFSNLLTLKTK